MQQGPDDSRFGDEHTALMLMFVRVRVLRVFFGGKQPLGTFRAREEKIPYGGGHVRRVRVRKIPSQYSLNVRVSQHRYYYINYYYATFLSGVRVQVGPPLVTLGVIKV